MRIKGRGPWGSLVLRGKSNEEEATKEIEKKPRR